MKKNLLILLIFTVFSFTNAQTMLYVDKDATGANNGSNWTDAFTDLQTAIDLGYALNREVWVKAGTYIPNTTNRSTSFIIKNNTRMYGGFNGTETNLADRDPEANPTILSGDLLSNDNSTLLDTETTRSDNSYHVISYSGNITATIDGFTISGGNANGGTSLLKRGAAIYSATAANGNVTDINFWNCIIEKNTATDAAVFYHDNTSGITNTTSQVSFNNSIVRDNYSNVQANVFLSGNKRYSQISRVAFNGCLVYNNVSSNSAAFVMVNSSSYAGAVGGSAYFHIRNCTITENTGANYKVTKIVNGFSYENQLFNSIIYNNGTTNHLLSPFDHHPASSIQSSNYMTTDPQFVSPTTDNFNISSSSFAVDSGDNSNVPSFLTTDLTGGSRILGTTVDMGAYEYNATLSNNNVEPKDYFNIYPNPVNNILHIKTKTLPLAIDIYNIRGQKVLHTTQTSINLSSMVPGIYLLKLKYANKKDIIKKFVKK